MVRGSGSIWPSDDVGITSTLLHLLERRRENSTTRVALNKYLNAIRKRPPSLPSIASPPPLLPEMNLRFGSLTADIHAIRVSADCVCCRIFEKIRYYFGNSSESIPMSFVLGFYVSLVVKRWWEQYKLLPWPDNLALFISAAIPGNVSIRK